MKTLKFLVDVPDKNTGKKYLKDKEYEFNNKRATEILSARRKNGKAFAVLVEEVETATKKVEAEEATID